MQRTDGELIREEFQFAGDLLHHALKTGEARIHHQADDMRTLPESLRQELGNELKDLRQRHIDLWPQRTRPGGLDISVITHFDRLLTDYNTNTP